MVLASAFRRALVSTMKTSKELHFGSKLNVPRTETNRNNEDRNHAGPILKQFVIGATWVFQKIVRIAK